MEYDNGKSNFSRKRQKKERWFRLLTSDYTYDLNSNSFAVEIERVEHYAEERCGVEVHRIQNDTRR